LAKHSLYFALHHRGLWGNHTKFLSVIRPGVLVKISFLILWVHLPSVKF